MKILFIAYGGGHMASLIPLITALKNKKNVEPLVCGLTTSQKALQKERIDYFGYANLPFPPTQYVLDRGKELSAQLNTMSIDLEESISYLGWNMVELEETYGVEEARTMYAKEGRHCFFPFQLMKRVITEGGIDVVVSTNSPRSERAALEAASSLGIPSLCVVDLFATHEKEWISKPGFSSKVCVISNSVKNDLMALGRPENDIVVTGNPAFDPYYAPFAKEKIQSFKKQHGISPESKVILYASNPESALHIFSGKKGDADLPKKVLASLLKFINEHPDYTLIFRPHPSQIFENNETYERVIFDKGFDLLTVLHTADVVVTLASTVGIQAQIVGKPLICINSSVYAGDIPYEEFGDVVRVNSLEELDKTILFANKNMQKKPSNLKKQKNATSNIMKLLDNYVKIENL